MKIREVYNSRIPKFLGVGAIVLYPFVLYAESDPPQSTIDHEWVHVGQVERIGFLSFYVSYVLYYWANRLSGRDKVDAYLSIPYEIEARYVNKEW